MREVTELESPLCQFAALTFRLQDVSPPGRIQRFLLPLYILSFVIFKVRLTTFIKAMMMMILLIRVKPKHQETKRLAAKRPGAK